MIKNLMQLYSLSICFISTIIILVCLIFLTQSVIDIAFFESRHFDKLEQFKDNRTFIFTGYNSSDTQLSEKELSEKRIIKKNDFIQSAKTASINTIINTVVGIVASLIFLIIHLKVYRRYSIYL